MAKWYAYGDFIALSPRQFDGNGIIRNSACDPPADVVRETTEDSRFRTYDRVEAQYAP